MNIEFDRTYGIKIITWNKYPLSVFNILETEMYIDNGKEWEYVR